MELSDAETNVPKNNTRVLFEVCCKVNFKRQFLFQLYIFKKKLLILWVTVSVLNIIACISKPSAFISISTVILFLCPFFFASVGALNEILSCEDIPDKYTFYQDRIENSDFRGDTAIYFNEIKIAYETESYFYIHVRKNIWCIIDKDKFTIGNADDMKIFLEEQLGSRFNINKKKGR